MADSSRRRKRRMDVDACPAEAALVEFAGNALSSERHEAVQRHLTNCPRCSAAVEWLTTHRLRSVAGNLGEDDELDECDDAADDESVAPGVRTLSVVSGYTPNAAQSDDVAARFDPSCLHPSQFPNSLGRLAKFEVLSIIDHGGFSVILKAFDPGLGRILAIKVLDQNLATDEKARLRFAREAQAAALINHPHVVTIHGFDEHDGLPFIVMEYVEGGSLARAIRRRGRFEPRDVVRHGLQISAALIAAHLRGVIHRDVKPANLLLERATNRLRLTDFGLALTTAQHSLLTTQGRVLGTPGYMSPEQVESEPVDFRTDLFGAGCVLYEMLTGIAPFRGQSYLEISQKTLHEPVEPIRKIVPHVPPLLENVVTQLLQKNPDDRPQDAAELEKRLIQMEH